MAFTQRKRSKYLIIPILITVLTFLFLCEAKPAVINSERDTDIDIAMGTLGYFFNPADISYEESQGHNLPDIKMGIYFGGYMSSKSRLFTFFFNTKNVYSIYEAGVALNSIEEEDYFMLSIPFSFDLAYRIPLGTRLSFYPFAGTGLDFVRIKEGNNTQWQFYYLIETGIELKYSVWKNTYLKLRVSYGLMFIDQLESGYMHLLKVRFPVPFLP
jgi:hypothetical protein